LTHLEGFFSKKSSTHLPAPDSSREVVLELRKPLSEERRFCIDYRWINQFLVSRQVLAPDVNGTIANCRNAKRMSKIDITRAFNRLLMHADSRHLTAFKTRQGTFRWTGLPFGLKVGPAWWQAFINAQLNELLDLFASAYADDVLAHTDEDGDEAHFNQVEEVIYRLHVAEPLTRLLKKDAPLDLGPEQEEAFESLKKLAVHSPILGFFVPGRETKVETVASHNATGGIILHKQDDGASSRARTLGPKFVVTDHQALVYWSSKRLLSTRQVRWVDFLANFDITFQHRRGQENIAADALSRKTVNTPTVRGT
jgi:hypothetical protein